MHQWWETLRDCSDHYPTTIIILRKTWALLAKRKKEKKIERKKRRRKICTSFFALCMLHACVRSALTRLLFLWDVIRMCFHVHMRPIFELELIRNELQWSTSSQILGCVHSKNQFSCFLKRRPISLTVNSGPGCCNFFVCRLAASHKDTGSLVEKSKHFICLLFFTVIHVIYGIILSSTSGHLMWF